MQGFGADSMKVAAAKILDYPYCYVAFFAAQREKAMKTVVRFLEMSNSL